MGYRRFMLRGLVKVKREWALVVTCYNLRRMFIMSSSK
jgi:IS5 family transposase